MMYKYSKLKEVKETKQIEIGLTGCHELNICVSQNSYFEDLSPMWIYLEMRS